MGDHPDMMCDTCIFDKRIVKPTAENLLARLHICKAKPGERICKWYQHQLEKIWKVELGHVSENIQGEAEAGS